MSNSEIAQTILVNHDDDGSYTQDKEDAPSRPKTAAKPPPYKSAVDLKVNHEVAESGDHVGDVEKLLRFCREAIEGSHPIESLIERVEFKQIAA